MEYENILDFILDFVSKGVESREIVKNEQSYIERWNYSNSSRLAQLKIKYITHIKSKVLDVNSISFGKVFSLNIKKRQVLSAVCGCDAPIVLKNFLKKNNSRMRMIEPYEVIVHLLNILELAA